MKSASTNASLLTVTVLTVTASCLFLGGAAEAQDAGFTTTWSKAGDLEGFESRAGEFVHVDEGGNPLGFLKTVKTTTIVPKPYLRNNLGELFGTDAGTISFDLKALGDQSISGGRFFLSTGTRAFSYYFVAKSIIGRDQTAADGWVHYEIPWQANWTTAEAISNKWVPFSGERDQWASVIDKPIWSELQATLVPGAKTIDQSIGIDNFRIEAGQVLDEKSLGASNRLLLSRRRWRILLSMRESATFCTIAVATTPTQRFTAQPGFLTVDVLRSSLTATTSSTVVIRQV